MIFMIFVKMKKLKDVFGLVSFYLYLIWGGTCILSILPIDEEYLLVVRAAAGESNLVVKNASAL